MSNISAVMVSAPPLIAWRYRADPRPDTPEAALVAVSANTRMTKTIRETSLSASESAIRLPARIPE
jgi:hypothetical protein